jgi:arabinose-5-phosphate isomerase
VITGLGKSGLVAQRAAATWTSLGLETVFVHPVDGLHGDLRIMPNRGVLVAVTWSGETPEVQHAAYHAVQHGCWRVVLVTGPCLPMKLNSIVHIELPRVNEPLPPAPLVASTLQSAVLDELAVRTIGGQHSAESFRLHHPGGSIGNQ